MTTMRTLLTSAIRKTRARPLGDDPAAEEMDAALEEAQALFLQLTNRQLTDVLISANYEAGENERITDTSGTATVTYPASIGSGSDERPPRNGAIVEVSGASPTRKIYVSELGAWKTIGGLTLDDAHPFGETLTDDLAWMIAVRLCGPVFQKEATADVVTLAEAGRSRFDARFAQPITAEVDPGLRQRTYYTYDDWSQS